MHPILIEFGVIKIFTYGLLVASGFFVGILLAAHQGKKEGFDPQIILDLCFYILLSAVLGARILYVIVEYEYFLASPLDILKVWKGGLVYYGGLILAGGFTWVFLRKKQMPIWQVADILAPSLALGQAIGRWGCFFAGCCYGVRTDVSWAITFSDPRSLAPLNIPLHPTQVYLSLNALLIFTILIWMRKHKTFHGKLFWAYGILYSIGRFIIEYFRGDDRGYALENILSTSQFIGIFTLTLSVVMLLSLQHKHPSH
ncbi:MAG: prolipoprotein diacylglyceryl transferase [Nitrospinota bacterium]|nr:prolipoprotein diacylglyceryl transferase [Nitrospinota bacterium]